MKRLSRVLPLVLLLAIVLTVVNAGLVAAAPPTKYSEHVQLYEVDEEEGIVLTGVRHVNLRLNWGEVETQVVAMNMTQNFKVHTWNPEAEGPGELLAIIEMGMALHGTVLTDVWFPDDESEGGLVVDEGVIDGHVVLQWNVVPFAEELPPEIFANLQGMWNL